MCATAVGVVVESLGDEVIVDLDGRLRHASALMTPGLRPGDLVLIGLGVVLARVDPDDHAALATLLSEAAVEPSLEAIP
jgi:hydrogenase maturation factor